ncbi:conserved hypothetical protein [Vibrio chagasii]|uniref:hypothetical protein n=1 Tax=Vibrio sp. 1CM8B TaxID=2929167 RepID=UPI0020C05128|nr:hypothetical protein [Vibrio sp. 1CM8B]CAH6837209.1 conserved hypothetical protein [Vibrio chagasii]MCK8085395.1 hypothetical protein [Vibrio sp. 1CM8B]CAH7064739.1 conserved hypothetical protein [Vibrio chagasii]CAH7216037.1 conserved hypothetical protein [Vibrio chagasii]CAH7441393.1 conserved hypothetical protein [Vibrio chagasii]
MCFKFYQEIFNSIDELNIGIKPSDSFSTSHVTPEKFRSLAASIYDSILNVGSSRFNLRLILEGKDIHPAMFIESRIGDGLIEHSVVDGDNVVQFLKKGGTFVFDHMNDYIPQARLVQEYIESKYGVKCWVQCYVTCSKGTAFFMHADDHPFIIFQIMGKKQWNHDNNTPNITYSVGDMAFYPRGKKHNVHGLGELTMHLTVAFEGYNDTTYDQLSLEEKLKVLKPRVGSSLPYSIAPELLKKTTNLRAYYNHFPPLKSMGSYDVLITPKKRIKLKPIYSSILKLIQTEFFLNARDISNELGLPESQVMDFLLFGLKEGLIIKGCRDESY